MTYMFQGASSFNQNLVCWDTSLVSCRQTNIEESDASMSYDSDEEYDSDNEVEWEQLAIERLQKISTLEQEVKALKQALIQLQSFDFFAGLVFGWALLALGYILYDRVVDKQT